MSDKIDPKDKQQVADNLDLRNNDHQEPKEAISDDLKHEQEVAVEAAKPQYHPMILSDLSAQRSTSFWRGYKLFWPFLKPYWLLALLSIAYYSCRCFRCCYCFILKAFYRQCNGKPAG